MSKLNQVNALVLTVITLACTAHAEGPATRPTTQSLALSPRGLKEVVRIWPGEMAPTGLTDAGEKVTPRGTLERPEYGVSKITQASLAVYLPANATAATPAVVICPGGGYVFEAASSEGHEIADRLTRLGVAAFVLKYRLPNGHAPAEGTLPVPQQDVLRAIQVVRAGATPWHIDPQRVGVIGFSAGGHLAATAATMYDQADLLAKQVADDATSKLSARPDFAVLVYPVISMAPGTTHGGSRKALIGETADDATTARFSADKLVTPKTPPLLIVHAEDDRTVPIANARLMADAAKAAGVPCELVVFRKGGHGFGLGRPGTEAAAWFGDMTAWLKTQKMID